MHADTSTSQDPKRSPLFAAFAAIISAGLLVEWYRSGHAYDLIGALAFATMAPVWYLTPISFTSPIQEQLKRRSHLPRWAQALTFLGLLLLLASVALRLVA